MTNPYLNISETKTPATVAELAQTVAEESTRRTAIYPVGGGTSLNYGLPGKKPGIALSLAGLNQIVDYPARDMTVTVHAGITLETLSAALASENQQLPFDVPAESAATLGGIVATNWNGLRRLGYGDIRDFVIGIQAVDGRGMPFRGGGRVVKNVAGYDFCKLLTGSLGTLGVITELTFKLKPQSQQSRVLLCELTDLEQAEQLVSAFSRSLTKPVAIQLVSGVDGGEMLGLSQSGSFCLAVLFEGTETEVAWQSEQLSQEWREMGVNRIDTLETERGQELLACIRGFADDENAATVVRAVLVPSAVMRFLAAVRRLAPTCSFQADCGTGTAMVKFTEPPDDGIEAIMLSQIHPLATSARGHAHVVSARDTDLTRQALWGTAGDSLRVMTAVKRQFDPSHLLNPGRFLFSD